MAWTLLLAVLGVFLAIPMKRQMINIEQLPFPSGLAAAETLRSLYAKRRGGIEKGKKPWHSRCFWWNGGIFERQHALLVARLP